MSVLLLLVALVGSVLAVRWFLYWSIPEIPEDVSTAADQPANPALFYDPRTWAIFQPIPLISYRRDKKGRFRKMP